MVGLTASQAVAHPAYAGIVRNLKPTKRGTVQSASYCGIPCNITYEIHGQGPKKIVVGELSFSIVDFWVNGLGTLMCFWYRQCIDFGHDKASEYSSLIFDNRGMGESGKPWIKYTMKMFAQDVVAVVDHVGWTEERQLHVIGASMGGMIVQELALLIPQRICSLTLIATGPRRIDEMGWKEGLWTRVRVFVPQTLDAKLERYKWTFVGDDYANSPDDVTEADEGLPLFPTHGDRCVAEWAYMHHQPAYTHWGWIRQALAMQGWQMTNKDLAQIGDLVGRKRIMSIHGKEDRALPMINNEELVNGLGGAGPDGIKVVLLDRCGHIPAAERKAEFAELLRTLIQETSMLGKQG